MKHLFSVVTVVGGLIGALLLFVSFAMDSAPQQGALAATAVGFAVIPYCITRAIQLLTDKRDDLLRSIVSEIRRGTLMVEPSAAVMPRPKYLQEFVAAPSDGITKQETPVHSEKEATGQGDGEVKDDFGRTKACPSCKEMNFRNARACFPCGKVLPKYVGAEPASWLG
ncbi:MAG: hypothetical protein OXO50_01585 [Caldilineaceae bacterium]|nr:hypothetical protein [Caldilineaceae bacterium]